MCSACLQPRYCSMEKEVSEFNTDSVPGFLCVCVHACVLSPAAPVAGQLCRESHAAGRHKMQVAFFTSSTWFGPEQV